jgi:hypothetical protein
MQAAAPSASVGDMLCRHWSSAQPVLKNATVSDLAPGSTPHK